MSDSDKPDILGRFGLKRVTDWASAPWLGPLLMAVMSLLFFLAILTAGAMLGHAIFDLGLGTPRGGFGTGAVTVALLGAPFVIWRAVVAQKQADIAQEGLITDRINKAVEGLGAEKTIKRDGEEYSQPNLEVRIGAIYALERIAQDSDRDHVQIMEILCAYIRQNGAKEGRSLPAGQQKPEKWVDWAWKIGHSPKLDVDAALNVISRRSEARKQHEREKNYHLYLEKAPLWGTALRWLDLNGANLSWARLQGSVLVQIRLNGASFQNARLQGAIFLKAGLRGTKFHDAKLHGAFFEDVEMDAETNFKDASLDGVALREVDLTNVKLIAERLVETFGDGTVTLPAGCDRPAHWPERKLGDDEFRDAWRKWLADRDNYAPPKEPDG